MASSSAPPSEPGDARPAPRAVGFAEPASSDGGAAPGRVGSGSGAGSAFPRSLSKSDSHKARLARVVVDSDATPAEARGTTGVLSDASTGRGRTPRTKGGVEKGTHTVESTGGARLCAKTWPCADLEAKGARDAGSRPLVVLVHQYSVMGGCQDLMVGMAKCLNALGYRSITGAPEVDDVISVCKWAAERYGRRILLVGSSAGAPIAGSALDAVDAVDGYVGIGYVFGFWASILFGAHFSRVLASKKPKLFIMGTRDGFTSVKQLEERVASAAGVAEMKLVPGVGHFELEFAGYDTTMAEWIASFAGRLEEMEEAEAS